MVRSSKHTTECIEYPVWTSSDSEGVNHLAPKQGANLVSALTSKLSCFLFVQPAGFEFNSKTSWGFWPILNTGERAVFYCFTFLLYPAAAP